VRRGSCNRDELSRTGDVAETPGISLPIMSATFKPGIARDTFAFATNDFSIHSWRATNDDRGGGPGNGSGRHYKRSVLNAHASAKAASATGPCTSGTCPDCRVHVARQLLASEMMWGHTPLTYHRTWETGVGGGNEGRRIQPFNLLSHLTSRNPLHHYNPFMGSIAGPFLRNRGN
jgi:hypothetical protein